MNHLLTLILVVIGLLAMAVATAPAMAAAGQNVRDALLKATRALPASTAAVTSTAIDTGTGTGGSQLADVELLLSAPAVSTGQLPDTKTFTYAIIHSDNSDLSSPSTLFSAVITQTGSTGAAAATKRFGLPTDTKRYVGFTITPSASGTGDASAATATLEVLA